MSLIHASAASAAAQDEKLYRLLVFLDGIRLGPARVRAFRDRAAEEGPRLEEPEEMLRRVSAKLSSLRWKILYIGGAVTHCLIDDRR